LVTARWAAICRTDGTNAVGDHVVNCRMNMGDAMMMVDAASGGRG
jgi:hypothetical protein